MSDLTQFINDPALCAQLQSFNPQQFVGLAGAPFIEQIVQYFKEQWGVSTKLAPLGAILFGVALNLILSVWTGLPVLDAVSLGLVTGFAASGWHVINR